MKLHYTIKVIPGCPCYDPERQEHYVTDETYSICLEWEGSKTLLNVHWFKTKEEVEKVLENSNLVLEFLEFYENCISTASNALVLDRWFSQVLGYTRCLREFLCFSFSEVDFIQEYFKTLVEQRRESYNNETC